MSPRSGERRRGKNVGRLDYNVTPSLGPGNRIVEQTPLLLDIAANLIGPENDYAIELPVFGLLHRHGDKIMRMRMPMLALKGHAPGDDPFDLRACKFGTAKRINLLPCPENSCSSRSRRGQFTKRLKGRNSVRNVGKVEGSDDGSGHVMIGSLPTDRKRPIPLLSDRPLPNAVHSTLGVTALNGRRYDGNIAALSPGNRIRKHRCRQRIACTGQDFEALAICRSGSTANSGRCSQQPGAVGSVDMGQFFGLAGLAQPGHERVWSQSLVETLELVRRGEQFYRLRYRDKHSQSFRSKVLTLVDQYDGEARCYPVRNHWLFEQCARRIAYGVELFLSDRRKSQRVCEPAPTARETPGKAVNRRAFSPAVETGYCSQSIGQTPTRAVHEGKR